jgi:hypothetical protein
MPLKDEVAKIIAARQGQSPEDVASAAVDRIIDVFDDVLNLIAGGAEAIRNAQSDPLRREWWAGAAGGLDEIRRMHKRIRAGVPAIPFPDEHPPK